MIELGVGLTLLVLVAAALFFARESGKQATRASGAEDDLNALSEQAARRAEGLLTGPERRAAARRQLDDKRKP